MSAQRPGSVAIVQRVQPGREEAYLEWSTKINLACSRFPGFLDLEVFDPVPGESEGFIIVIRFETEPQSRAWHTSSTCRQLLEEARPLLAKAVRHPPSSLYGSWFTGPGHDGEDPPPAWKQALVVLLVLYPTVMVLNHWVMKPFFHHWSGALSMFLANMMSVTLLTWVLMPWVTRRLRFWLHPGSPQEDSRLGAGGLLVLGLQAGMVLCFYLLAW